MAVDEELLRPSREHIALLRGKIAALEAETAEKVSRWPNNKEYAREMWGQSNLAIESMRREIEAFGKVIADYYGLQVTPPPIVVLDGVSRFPEIPITDAGSPTK